MKFDPNCVRDLLLLVEDCNEILLRADAKIADYDFDTISSHANKCNQAGLFVGFEEYIDRSIFIEDLSIKGHQLLCEMRDEKTWKRFLNSAKPMVLSCIESLITAFLKTKF